VSSNVHTALSETTGTLILSTILHPSVYRTIQTSTTR